METPVSLVVQRIYRGRINKPAISFLAVFVVCTSATTFAILEYRILGAILALLVMAPFFTAILFKRTAKST